MQDGASSSEEVNDEMRDAEEPRDEPRNKLLEKHQVEEKGQARQYPPRGEICALQ